MITSLSGEGTGVGAALGEADGGATEAGPVEGGATDGAADGCGVAAELQAARIGARAATGPTRAAVSSSWRRLIRRSTRAR
jgi:hypothetical protein